MWYAMQVKSGSEKKVVSLCKANFKAPLLNECFYFQKEMSRRKNGERKNVIYTLFPGYLFVDSDDIHGLYQRLWHVPELTKLLRVDGEIIAIQGEERAFLEKNSDDRHVFRLSKGYQIDGYIKIEEGAFTGFYGKLLYVNRHGRKAKMRIHMFQKERVIEFGLEVIQKIKTVQPAAKPSESAPAASGQQGIRAWHSHAPEE